jgi:GNAT superfamily N-acetyltransferase
MREIIFIIEPAPEGGFTARALGPSIFTEADDIAGLDEQVRDAVHCHFDELPHDLVIRLITVRPATPQDIEAAQEVAALATETLRETYRPIPNPPGDGIGSPVLTRIVAEVEGRIVGTVQYGVKGSRLHVIGLMVHPDHRRKGVARAILESLAGTARDLGTTHLSLYTIRETGNVPIFERMGFAVVREEAAAWAESDRFDALTDVYMERMLSD